MCDVNVLSEQGPPALLDVIIPSALVASRKIIVSTLVSLRECTETDDYRIIFVLNANLAHHEAIGKVADLILEAGVEKRTAVLLMDKQAGFSRACNMGLVYSEAPWLCLLNDDVTLFPYWDRIMIDHLKETGASLCVPASKQPGRISSKHRYPNTEGAVQVNHMLPFFAAVLPRLTIEKYGLLSMDPKLAVLGSDDEYCARILQTEGKIILAVDCLFDPLHRTTVNQVYDANQRRRMCNDATNYLKGVPKS